MGTPSGLFFPGVRVSAQNAMSWHPATTSIGMDPYVHAWRTFPGGAWYDQPGITWPHGSRYSSVQLGARFIYASRVRHHLQAMGQLATHPFVGAGRFTTPIYGSFRDLFVALHAHPHISARRWQNGLILLPGEFAGKQLCGRFLIVRSGHIGIPARSHSSHQFL